MSIAGASGTSLCRCWCRGFLGLGHRDRAGVLILCRILGGTGLLAGPRPSSGSAIRIRLLELAIPCSAIRRIALVIGHEHNDHGSHRDYRHNGCDNRSDRGTADAAIVLLGIILLVVLGRLLVKSTVIIAIGSRHGLGTTLGIENWRECTPNYNPRRPKRCRFSVKMRQLIFSSAPIAQLPLAIPLGYQAPSL